MTTKAGYFAPTMSRADLSNFVATIMVWNSFASPESESRHASASMSFEALPDIEALAREQGVSSSAKFEDLLGSFWSDDESVEDFLAARERWRREGPDREA